MRVALFCATQRGHQFLYALRALLPDADLLVFSFAEDSWEPRFLEDIRQLTQASGGQFHQAKQVGAPQYAALWEAAPVDLMFAVSWRYIIPPQVYQRARLGAYVFHDSLLPEYRGFAPTVWAIRNGEDHTGVTLLEMAGDYDTGAIIGQQRVPIGPDETIADVMQRATSSYLDLLAAYLPALVSGSPPRRAQDETQASYTVKLLPDDFRIDWNWPTDRIYNLIRAATKPYAGAFTTLRGENLRIWSARRLTQPRRYVGRVPGRVAEIRAGEGSIVLTGDGALLVTQVQLDNAESAPVEAVLRRISDTLGR
ncbi:MAG: methionyl-tRNA formyltransferase [Anaerolineae bacterium]|nr:methionyl-tRNA formyltransferase [Anaerolineae bacterium]